MWESSVIEQEDVLKMPAAYDREFRSETLNMIMRAPRNSLYSRCNYVTQQLREQEISIGINTLLRWSNLDSLDRTFTRKSSKPVRTTANIEKIANLIERTNGRMSIRRMAQETRMSYKTVWNIVRKDLKMYPYKLQKGQELTEHQMHERREFCKKMLNNIRNDPDYHRKIVFSDETSKQSSSPRNSQNTRVLSKSQPHCYYVCKPRSRKVNAICAVNYSLGITGPFFFDKNIDRDEYRKMLQDHLFPSLTECVPVRETRANRDAKSRYLFDNFIFQQDGASVHHTRENIQFIKEKFKTVISLDADIKWPPCSPDLSPLDYWLWGQVKPKCTPTADFEEMKREFTEIIHSINSDTIKRAIDSWPERLRLCLQQNGGRFESHLHRSRRQQTPT